MEGDTEGLSLPDVAQPAGTSNDDPEPPAASPPGAGGQHESRLVALIAHTALEEVNPCRAMDVAVFLDSERLSAVGRRMRATLDFVPLFGDARERRDDVALPCFCGPLLFSSPSVGTPENAGVT